jgi:hypothetical protein
MCGRNIPRLVVTYALAHNNPIELHEELYDMSYILSSYNWIHVPDSSSEKRVGFLRGDYEDICDQV